MPYQLRPGESIPRNIRRIAREELDSAAAQLTGHGDASRDVAIHEARKSIKKVRALLRLVRGELGETFPQENARLGAMGRKLSGFRDAGVVIETFDALLRRYREELKGQTLASIRRALVARKVEVEKGPAVDRALGGVARSLRAVRRRVAAWPLQRQGFPALAPGLEKAFRRARKALALAHKDPSAGRTHELRKRVKDHWYHVCLFEPLWTGAARTYAGSLKDIEAWLGDAQNMAVLRDKVAAEPARYGAGPTVARFLALAVRYQKELREKAASAGQRIYAEKPGQFKKRMRRLWHAWERKPMTGRQGRQAPARRKQST